MEANPKPRPSTPLAAWLICSGALGLSGLLIIEDLPAVGVAIALVGAAGVGLGALAVAVWLGIRAAGRREDG